MRRFSNPILAIPVCALLTACAATDSVVFVTKTSLGIDIDGSAPGASVAYDRVEGYLAPRYANAAAPPVYADFGTNGNIFVDRKIKQVYATGKAAKLISMPEAGTGPAVKTITYAATGLSTGPAPRAQPIGRAMFFGTSTVVGLKFGYSTSAIESVTLGFKRKEFSQIPGVGDPDDYPSTLTSFDNHTATAKKDDASLLVRQFFATGEAADNLAASGEIPRALRHRAEDAVAGYREQERQQTRSVLVALTCVAKLDDAALPKVWDHAEALQIFDDAGVLADIRAATAHGARAIYTDNLRQFKADSTYHSALLRGHAERVCKLAAGG